MRWIFISKVLLNISIYRIIREEAGKTIVKYEHSPYGEVSSTLLDSTKEYIRQINPFLYRGYYYDKESSLYYLLSRYYDPRFKHRHYYFCLLIVLLGKDEENDGL